MKYTINTPPMPSPASAVAHAAGRPVASLKEQLFALVALALTLGEKHRPGWLDPGRFDDASRPVHAAAQVGTIITVVVIGIVSLIGLLIFAQVNTSISLPSGSNLSSSVQAIEDGFGGGMELVPVIIIVLLASIVIVVVQNMRGGDGM